MFMMSNKEMEKYLKDKLNEIRKHMFREFGTIGHISICVDYDYISATSSSHCKGKKEEVDFHVFYNANGENRFGEGE